MEPWDFAEQLTAAVDQELILKAIKPSDPFWIGASYGIDPFVGVIYQLPLSDPHRYETGLSAEMFDHAIKAILSGELRGDRLAVAVEALSRACTRDQWTKWYRPILEGNLDLRVPLALFNKYAPIAIAPPALSRPKPLTPQTVGAVPKEFFLQPAYEGRCFWLLDSRTDIITIRGYDENVVRIHDSQIEKAMIELGRRKPVDVVIFGYLDGGLVVDDLVTRDQFTRESSAYPLRQRLEAATRLGLPLVQRSDMLGPEDSAKFERELKLIFEQKFNAAILRDPNGVYPFRVQTDFKLTARSWAKTFKPERP